MVYEYEEAMEQSYVTSLVKAFKKNITDGFFSFIILDCINEKISDYEEMWSFAKTKGFKASCFKYNNLYIYRMLQETTGYLFSIFSLVFFIYFSIWNQSFFNKNVNIYSL